MLNEIKAAMVSTFQPVLEANEDSKEPAHSPRRLITVDTKETENFLGYKKQTPALGPKTLFISGVGTTGNEPSGLSALQQHVHETLDEKKRRLFKWNSYERVMIPLEQIKDCLIRNKVVLKYLSLFSEFNKVTLVMGSNKHMSLGLHI